MKTSAELSITILGCSGTYSSADSACSGYLVRSKSAAVLLDAGAGTSVELQRHIDLVDIDAIVVSHEHPDHWTELPTLYQGFRYGIERTGVPVFGTVGTRAMLQSAAPQALDATFDWTDIGPTSVLSIGDQTWTFSLTDHPVETLAARIESNGKSIAYSADTGPGWSPVEFDAAIDLMVYETSLPVDWEERGIPHISGRQAGERASDAGISSLVITHFPPGHDVTERKLAAEAAFGRAVEVAAPGLTFTV